VVLLAGYEDGAEVSLIKYVTFPIEGNIVTFPEGAWDKDGAWEGSKEFVGFNENVGNGDGAKVSVVRYVSLLEGCIVTFPEGAWDEDGDWEGSKEFVGFDDTVGLAVVLLVGNGDGAKVSLIKCVRFPKGAWDEDGEWEGFDETVKLAVVLLVGYGDGAKVSVVRDPLSECCKVTLLEGECEDDKFGDKEEWNEEGNIVGLAVFTTFKLLGVNNVLFAINEYDACSFSLTSICSIPSFNPNTTLPEVTLTKISSLSG